MLTHTEAWTKSQTFCSQFKMHFLEKKNNCILIEILLKNIPEGLTDNKPSMVQVMAWHQIHVGDKPSLSLRDQCIGPGNGLSPVQCPAITWTYADQLKYMHVSIINPQWVNTLAPGGFDYRLKLVNFKLILMINI